MPFTLTLFEYFCHGHFNNISVRVNFCSDTEVVYTFSPVRVLYLLFGHECRIIFILFIADFFFLYVIFARNAPYHAFYIIFIKLVHKQHNVTACGILLAKKVLLEVNEGINPKIRGLHDIYVPLDPPYRKEIPIFKPSDRAGSPVLHIDPAKIVGVVKTNVPEGGHPFAPSDETTMMIGENVCSFLLGELKAGRIPSSFLPLQSGVGNIANAVLARLDANPDIPSFDMFTEVIQDSVLKLIESGKCRFASTCSMTFSTEAMNEFFENIDRFHDKVLMRPAEISNNPEVIRRLGVITMNTALEADIFGNINSTHVTGTKMMNGIGGSADFTRNAYTSIFSCPSVAKGGLISAIVPMVSHLDHSEHSVDILITEQGIADLRGKSPIQKAETIIENCANPKYRPLLREYLKMSKGGHTPHTLRAAFAFHEAFVTEGDMSKTDFSKYC